MADQDDLRENLIQVQENTGTCFMFEEVETSAGGF